MKEKWMSWKIKMKGWKTNWKNNISENRKIPKKRYNFCSKIFLLLLKISIFVENFKFWSKFQFLFKISIFGQNFNFWSKFLVQNFLFKIFGSKMNVMKNKADSLKNKLKNNISEIMKIPNKTLQWFPSNRLLCQMPIRPNFPDYAYLIMRIRRVFFDDYAY